MDLSPRRMEQETTSKRPDPSNHDDNFDEVWYREEALAPTTRSLETWFMDFSGDNEEAFNRVIDVRVEFSKADIERRKRLQSSL